MMTRKDYVEVAKIISKHSKGDTCRLDILIDDFAFWFAEDNPNFKMEKFMEACNEQNFNNTGSTNISGQRVRFISHDVANAKRRLARNKKRFAKVNCDPEQDSKLLKFLPGPRSYPQAVRNFCV